MWPFSRPAHVRLTFLDSETGNPIYSTKSTVEALPDTFAPETTVDIRGTAYRVVSANPVTKEEFARSGILALRVTKAASVQSIAFENILYSLPTISNDFPATRPSPACSGPALTIHEDDWRQIEYVSKQFAPLVESEFVAIRQIYAQFQKGLGFTKTHIRKAIAEPLDPPIPLSLLAESLDVKATPGSLRIQGSDHAVVEGFALPVSDGAWVYGTAPGGDVRTLCFSPRAGDQIEPPGLRDVGSDLLFVNWRSAQVIEL